MCVMKHDFKTDQDYKLSRVQARHNLWNEQQKQRHLHTEDLTSPKGQVKTCIWTMDYWSLFNAALL